MVDAVNDEVESLLPVVARSEVKEKTVESVFRDSPGGYAKDEQEERGAEGNPEAQIDHQPNHRDENQVGDGRMNVREHLKEVALEHPRGFIFV